MIHDHKLIVVMPAYNAEKTLRQVYRELPHEYVDDIILVDDASQDRTSQISSELKIRTIMHRENMGYGANQKTCYREALKLGADIVVMLHPDYQYSPKLVGVMAHMVASGLYDVVLGSRILAQSLLMGQKLSEYHTGYRAFSRVVLETLSLDQNSDDFIFDNQTLCQAIQA